MFKKAVKISLLSLTCILYNCACTKKNGRIGEASKENSPLNVCQTNKG